MARWFCSTSCMMKHYTKRSEGCWEWTGPTNPRGYGVATVDNKSIGAHRLALKLSGVDVPDGKDVCHSCDNPSCVNPEHLWVGSRRQNLADARDKKRLHNQKYLAIITV